MLPTSYFIWLIGSLISRISSWFLFHLLNFLMEFFLPILKSFLQVTYLFSPHWLTLLYESWVGFVASFSSMKFLVVCLVLWLLMGVVGRLTFSSQPSSFPVLRSCSTVLCLCVCFLMCLCICGSVLCFMGSLPFSSCFCLWVLFFCCLL